MTFIRTEQQNTSWATGLDIDFSLLQSQTISSDGTYTIGPYATWKKENSTGESTAMALTNGTGLVITPNATSNYKVSDGTRTSPIIWLPFSSFLPGTFEWTSGIRIYCYASFINFNNNYDTGRFGIDSDNSNWYQGQDWYISGTKGLGAQYTQAYTSRNSGFGASSAISAFDSTNNVQMIEIPAIARLEAHSYYGSYSSGWPAKTSNMNYIGSYLAGMTSGSSPIDSTGIGVLARMGLIITAFKATATDAFQFIIKRIRVDYKI